MRNCVCTCCSVVGSGPAVQNSNGIFSAPGIWWNSTPTWASCSAPVGMRKSESIGQGIVATLSGSRSPAVLMRNHGVFTIGPSAKTAVKAAVMTEDVARTVHLARQLGEPLSIAQTDIDALYARYQNVYGQ